MDRQAARPTGSGSNDRIGFVAIRTQALMRHDGGGRGDRITFFSW